MKALLVIDMVKGFTVPSTKDGKCALFTPGAREIIPAINRKIREMDGKGVIFYITDCHSKQDMEFQRFPPHCIQKTEESELDSNLLIPVGGFDEDNFDEGEDLNGRRFLVYKNTVNCWDNEDMDYPFFNTLPEVMDLEVCGVVTEVCVAQAAMGAAIRGHKVTIDRNCVQGLDEKDSENTLCLLHKYYGVKVVN